MNEFNHQDFRFIGDDYKPTNAAFQFLYRGRVISASNIGVNRGGCPNEVTIFTRDMETVIAQFSTVEEAVDFLNL